MRKTKETISNCTMVQLMILVKLEQEINNETGI